MPTPADYEFGNACVELDLVSLDRVREALREVDASGGAKSLEQVLLDRKWLDAAQAGVARLRVRPSAPAFAPVPPPAAPAPGPAPAAAPGPALPWAPQIPGYTIVQKVGSGGAGDVYSARQLSMDRVVALKVLSARLAGDPKYTERFVREARAAAKLAHPNIIAVHDVGEHAGTYFMVMEFLDGPTLEKLLSQKGVLDESLVVSVGLQAARALEVARKHGLVHRDVKPGNLMLTSDGTVKLCDLGLAKQAGEGAEGKAVGTPRYISPEQAKDEPDVDIRSDLYSLGATLYHLATGQLPYSASTVRELLQKHVSEPLVPPRERKPGLGAGLNSIIVRLMEKDRRRRYQEPAELIQALESLRPAGAAAPEPAAASRPPSTGRSVASAYRRRSGGGGTGLAVFAFLAILVGGGAWMFRDRISKALEKPVRPGPSGLAGPTRRPLPSGANPNDTIPAEELEVIERYAAADPGFADLPRLLERYDAFKAKYRGQPWEAAGDAARRDYLAGAEAAAQERLRAIRAQERHLVAEEKFRDLAKLYEAFPPALRDHTPSGATAREEHAELVARIGERYTRDKAELEELIRSRKYADALHVVGEMEGYALSAQLIELAERKEALERLRKEEASSVAVEVRDRHLQLDPKLRELLATRRPREGMTLLKGAVFAAFRAEELPYVRVSSIDYAALQEAVAAAEGASDPAGAVAALGRVVVLCEAGMGDPETLAEASTAQMMLIDLRNAAALELLRRQVHDGIARTLKAPAKEKFQLATFPGDPGSFERRGTALCWVVEGKTAKELDPWTGLVEGDLLLLAARSYDDDRAKAEEKAAADPAHLLRGALAHYYARAGVLYAAKAHDLFQRASRGGVRGVKVYLSDLSGSLRDAEDRESGARLQEAKDLLAKKQWAEARAILEDLGRRGDSKFVREHRLEIESLLAQILDRLSRGADLGAAYKGKVEPLDGGRIRVTYDFENRAQVDLFETITGGGKIKGKWRLNKGCLESQAGASISSAIRWRTLLKGDVEVEYDLAVLDTVQNLSANLYYRPDSDRYYSATFGLDLVVGDMETKMLVPKACLLKHPLGFGKERAKMPAEWEKLRERFVGSPTADYALERGQKVRVKISRIGKKLSLACDGKTVFEGEDAEYTEGHLLFFADSRAQIDNLQITFKP